MSHRQYKRAWPGSVPANPTYRVVNLFAYTCDVVKKSLWIIATFMQSFGTRWFFEEVVSANTKILNRTLSAVFQAAAIFLLLVHIESFDTLNRAHTLCIGYFIIDRSWFIATLSSTTCWVIHVITPDSEVWLRTEFFPWYEMAAEFGLCTAYSLCIRYVIIYRFWIVATFSVIVITHHIITPDSVVWFRTEFFPWYEIAAEPFKGAYPCYFRYAIIDRLWVIAALGLAIFTDVKQLIQYITTYAILSVRVVCSWTLLLLIEATANLSFILSDLPSLQDNIHIKHWERPGFTVFKTGYWNPSLENCVLSTLRI